MKTNLDRQIASKEEAKAYLRELATNNESYHPDDSADTIVWDGLRLPLRWKMNLLILKSIGSFAENFSQNN